MLVDRFIKNDILQGAAGIGIGIFFLTPIDRIRTEVMFRGITFKEAFIKIKINGILSFYKGVGFFATRLAFFWIIARDLKKIEKDMIFF